MKRKFSGNVYVCSKDQTRFFSASISSAESYAGNLEQAFVNEKNCAEAFVFLATLAARHLDPHHYHKLTPTEEAEWRKYFRPQAKI